MPEVDLGGGAALLVEAVEVVTGLGWDAAVCFHCTHLRVRLGVLFHRTSLGTTSVDVRLVGGAAAAALVCFVPPLVRFQGVCVGWRQRHLIGLGWWPVLLGIRNWHRACLSPSVPEYH